MRSQFRRGHLGIKQSSIVKACLGFPSNNRTLLQDSLQAMAYYNPGYQSRCRSPRDVSYTVGRHGDVSSLLTSSPRTVKIRGQEYRLPQAYYGYAWTGSLRNTQLALDPADSGAVIVIPLGSDRSPRRFGPNNQYMQLQYHYPAVGSAPMARGPSGGSSQGRQFGNTFDTNGFLAPTTWTPGQLYVPQIHHSQSHSRAPQTMRPASRRATRSSESDGGMLLEQSNSSSSNVGSWDGDEDFFPKKTRRAIKKQERKRKEERRR